MRLALSLAILPGLAWAAAPASIVPIPLSVANVMHDPRGHTMVCYTDGSCADDGIANTRGNVSFAAVGSSGTQVMPAGTHYAWVTGNPTSLTIQLPPNPQINDVARIGSASAIPLLTVQDAVGNTVATGTCLPGMAQMAFAYFGTWTPIIAPGSCTPVVSVFGQTGAVTAAQAASALAGSFDAAGVAAAETTRAKAAEAGLYPLGGNPAGYITQAAITALGLGSAAYQPASAFYPASNPSGFITASQVPGYTLPAATASVLGGVTLAQIPAAYILPSATATMLGGVKSGITLFNRTTSPISVTLGSVSVLGAGILPSVSVTVPGVSAGDFVQASYAAAVPASITITGAQATAANTVLVTPAATGALTAASQVVSLNFMWMH